MRSRRASHDSARPLNCGVRRQSQASVGRLTRKCRGVSQEPFSNWPVVWSIWGASMDTQMKIDADTVRTLREEKSWSQEHLASAAGLSVRTVQRVESDGFGSAETRLALAGALGVPVGSLLPVIQTAVGAHARHGSIAVFLVWGIGAVCSSGAIVYNYFAGHISAGETGEALGIICALLGATAGAMGALSHWVKARGSAA